MTKTRVTPKTGRKPAKPKADKAAGASKLDTLVSLLRGPTGASIQELAAATSWQSHSVRGALAGALKKKGHTISSELVEGVRRYCIAEGQA
jgi:hypothetical protein